jgi:hypothetical protein
VKPALLIQERIIGDHSLPNPPLYAYDKNASSASEEQWARVTEMLKTARGNFENNKNEKAWMIVALDVMNAVSSFYKPKLKEMLAIEDV